MVLVRNALFSRVRLAAAGHAPTSWEGSIRSGAAASRAGSGRSTRTTRRTRPLLIDADARSMAYLGIDESDEQADHVWHVRQTFSDPEGDHDFAIAADVDLDASQEEGEAVFKNYRVGFFEEL